MPEQWGLNHTPEVGTRVKVIRAKAKGRVGTVTGVARVASGGVASRDVVNVKLDAIENRAPERVIQCFPSSLVLADTASPMKTPTDEEWVQHWRDHPEMFEDLCDVLSGHRSLYEIAQERRRRREHDEGKSA